MSDQTLVIGGGAAGLTAAIAAARTGAQVVLLEGGERLGRKILVSGNGHCNFSNTDAADLRHYHGADRRFIGTVLKVFSPQATWAWFRQMGVEAREKSRGRLFPRSDEARGVLTVLEEALQRGGVQVRTGCRVRRIDVRPEGGFRVHTDRGLWEAHRIVMATGGLAAPHLGADGSGFELVARLGHRVTPLHPGLVPLVSTDVPVRRLQGLRLTARVRAPSGTGGWVEDCDDLLFTRYGLSGLVILNLSLRIVPQLRQGPVQLDVDLFPERSQESLAEWLAERWRLNPQRTLEQSFTGIISYKLAGPFLRRFGFDPGQPVRAVGKRRRWALAQALHGWPIQVTEARPWRYAEITIGGVPGDEIRAETLESRLVPGLHLAGEMVDVQGDLGGYNLQWAWSSGWSAGQAAAGGAPGGKPSRAPGTGSQREGERR